jgi:hypothetical protein
MSRCVSADAHFLCNEAAVLGAEIKGRPTAEPRLHDTQGTEDFVV